MGITFFGHKPSGHRPPHIKGLALKFLNICLWNDLIKSQEVSSALLA